MFAKKPKMYGMPRLIHPNTFLKPTTERLGDVLRNFYLVPDYQRDFSWTKNEFKDFWEDISALANKSFNNFGTLVANPTPHFLGPIVLQEFPGDSDRRLEVMDGQQRLVTSSIFLSVSHEFCAKISDLDKRTQLLNSISTLLMSYISNGVEYHMCLARDQNHFEEMVCKRLSLTDKNAYWQANISSRTPKHAVINRIKECSDFFHQEITSYLDGLQELDRDTRLSNLVISLLELCVVLQMKVSEHGVAYEVFESLNARGLDLQQADLLKNKLFSISDTQGTKKTVTEAWEKVVRSIQQQSMINLNEFFYFYTIARYHFLRQSDLYRDVIKIVSSHGNSPLNYMQDAAKCAESLQVILEAGSGLPGNLERDVFSLRDLITNKFSLTMIIAGISRYAVNSPDLWEVIKLTHHYVFRRFVIEGLPMSTYAHEISEVARDFSNGRLADISLLRDRFRGLSKDSIFMDKLRSYSAPNNKVGFYVLEMIENYINNNAGMFVRRQSGSQHLEHIMPKRPTPNDWGHVINDHNYGDFVNRIGNLLILEADKNSHIKNKSFDYKSSNASNLDYANSGLTFPKLAKGYLNNGFWDFKSIESRQSDLVSNYALSVWGL